MSERMRPHDGIVLVMSGRAESGKWVSLGRHPHIVQCCSSVLLYGAPTRRYCNGVRSPGIIGPFANLKNTPCFD
jgi:hypothetical protein